MSDTATINLLPKQTEAWDAWEDALITELGYGGAAGGGKTRLGWYLVLAIAEAFPGSRAGVARKELKTLRLTTLAELFIIFMELGYKKDRDYTYNQQDGIVRFANGSEVLLLDTAYSPQDPEYTRFGSLNLTWAWIEESNETPEKARDILNTRIGRHNKFTVRGKKLVCKAFWLETFNPNKGHVYRNYYKPWKEGKLPKHRMFIRALPGDNPHLPEAYIEQLRNSNDPTIRQRLLLGNFDYDEDPRRLMSYDAITDIKSNTLMPLKDKDAERYLINDVARFGGDKIVLGEFEGFTLVGLAAYTFQDIDTTKQQIRDQAKESKVPYSHILSDEDGMGGGVIDGLSGTKGFLGGSRPLDIYDGFSGKPLSQNYANLRSQCYFKLAEMVNDRLMAVKLRYFHTNIEGFTQDMALSQLEEELDQIKSVDTSGQQTKLAVIPKVDIKEALGRSPDFADIFMMRMRFELTNVRTEEDKARAKPKKKLLINKSKKSKNRAM